MSNAQKEKGRHQLTFWGSAEEKEILDFLCKELEISRSEILRLGLELVKEQVIAKTLKLPTNRQFTRPTDKLSSQKIKQKYKNSITVAA